MRKKLNFLLSFQYYIIDFREGVKVEKKVIFVTLLYGGVGANYYTFYLIGPEIQKNSL